jgi:hypothetical protein
MALPRLKSIADEIAGTKKQLDGIIAEIVREEAARQKVEKLPRPADELIQQFNAAGDQLAAKAWGRIPRNASDLFTDPAVNGHNIDTRPIVEFFWAICGDEIKAKFAEKVRAGGPGIADDDRREQLKKHDDKINSLWGQYENLATEIEGAGFEVQRDQNIPPAVFLRWSDVDRRFDEDRIEKLRRVRSALKAEAAEFQHRIDILNAEDVAAERELLSWNSSRPEFRGSDPSRADEQTRLGEKVNEIRKRRAKLAADWDKHQGDISPALSLLQKCEEFLKSKGIGMRPGQVSLVR